MTRSNGSVSSAVRRSVERARLHPHDPGQRVGVARTRRRRSRPGRRRRRCAGRARGPSWRSPRCPPRLRPRRFMSPSGTCSGPGRPRRRNPCVASSWLGRSLVRGREPRDGRTRTSSSSSSRAAAPTGAHPSIPVQRSTNPGRVLPVVAMFSTTTPGTRSPSTAAAVASRWSSYVANNAAVQGLRPDDQAVVGVLHVAAECRDLPAAARPAGRSRGGAGARCRAASRDPRRARSIAAITGVSSPTSPRSTSMPCHRRAR